MKLKILSVLFWLTVILGLACVGLVIAGSLGRQPNLLNAGISLSLASSVVALLSLILNQLQRPHVVWSAVVVLTVSIGIFAAGTVFGR